VFNILNETTKLEISCACIAEYQLKRVTLTARHSTVYSALWTEKLNLLNNKTNSVSIGRIKCLRHYKLQHVFEYCLLSLTQTHNRFATRLLPCRWYVVRSRPINPLFRCVDSLFLWKPYSCVVVSQFKNFFLS